MSASPKLQDAISCAGTTPATSDQGPGATVTPPNDQNAPTGRIPAKRIAVLRGYVREGRRFRETFDRVREEGLRSMAREQGLHVGEPVARKSRFWDWFDRAPEWFVLAVLFGASGVLTLLAVVGLLYLLGGVL